jgi:hypothetical protein
MPSGLATDLQIESTTTVCSGVVVLAEAAPFQGAYLLGDIGIARRCLVLGEVPGVIGRADAAARDAGSPAPEVGGQLVVWVESVSRDAGLRCAGWYGSPPLTGLHRNTSVRQWRPGLE